MKELRCPKCGNVFKVDEADYATILNQVKNAEFWRPAIKRNRSWKPPRPAKSSPTK